VRARQKKLIKFKLFLIKRLTNYEKMCYNMQVCKSNAMMRKVAPEPCQQVQTVVSAEYARIYRAAVVDCFRVLYAGSLF